MYAIDEEDPEHSAYFKLEIYDTAGDCLGFLDELKEEISAYLPGGEDTNRDWNRSDAGCEGEAGFLETSV